MGFASLAQRIWGEMSVNSRRSFLKDLKEVTGHDDVFWEEKPPIEVLAHTPDLDSLPGDLCGVLLLSLTPSGFFVDKLKEFERKFFR